MLGRRMLLGLGMRRDIASGVALIDQATQRGDAEASVLAAIFAAWGFMRPRDFARAYALLAGAAGKGWEPAQRELALLSRPVLDHAAMVEARACSPLSLSPRISAVTNFLTSQECDWLIEGARVGRRRALVNVDSAAMVESDGRTNTETDYTIANASVMLAVVRERIANTLGLASSHFEGSKLLHYDPGQKFGLHADFQDTRKPELAREVELRGQRVATFLIYLNDDFEGGETDFPEANVRFKGKRGDALMFWNVDKRGAPDFRTVHAGLPPTRGQKWLFSQWVRSKPVPL